MTHPASAVVPTRSGGDCHQSWIEGELPNNGKPHQMPSASTTPLERFKVERISDHGNLRSIQDSRHKSRCRW
jgi:hypothetical protein